MDRKSGKLGRGEEERGRRERGIGSEKEEEKRERERERKREEDGRRNGSKQEQIHRGLGHCQRESGIQFPLDSPQPRPCWHLWHRHSRPCLQGHCP